MNQEAIKALLTTLGGMLIIAVGLLILATMAANTITDGAESAEYWWIGFALVVVGIVVIEPKRVPPLVGALQSLLPLFRLATSKTDKSDEDTEQIEKDERVLGATAERPAADTWYKSLRPVLHQASYYSVPTYYLDTELNLVDWNVAFELVFSDVIEKVRNQHVNSLIARFDNRGEVIDHARAFTRRYVERGDLPLIDFEPIRYKSKVFGTIDFLKVASQLHDTEGQLRGWAVALMVRKIDWIAFERDLFPKLEQDKLWSVYSGPYDRVLQEFPPYHELIRDIVAAVPSGTRRVIDLGAGTGNVVAKLLDAGHHVTAVENNIMMLDRLQSKSLGSERLTIVKGSVDHLESFRDEEFDAATMMNVLYAVDDPLACLNGIHRILKPEGVLSLSTTHSESRLTALLKSIESSLKQQNKFNRLAQDFLMLESINKKIELSIARRHSGEEYLAWIRDAGFEEVRCEQATYEDAVMLIHARKK